MYFIRLNRVYIMKLKPEALVQTFAYLKQVTEKWNESFKFRTTKVIRGME